jgi:hypothetical protein
MRLTIGPLPPAVYWRRRLVVLGAVLLVVLIVVYAFTGGPGAGSSAAPSTTSTVEPTATGTAAPTDSATATATATTTPSDSASPTPSAFTLPVPDATGPCTDAEIQLTASADPSSLTVGQAATFSLTIKNISNRTCNRNIGSAPQELRLQQQEKIIWSSDDCSQSSYDFDQQFTPGMEKSFSLNWNGYGSRGGVGSVECTPYEALKLVAGSFQLVARLDTKYSDAVQIVVRSNA